MNTNLIILAAGASSRMKELQNVEDLSSSEIKAANTSSKALISYGKEQRPILDFLLMNAEKAGYKNVCLIIGKESDAFKTFYGNKTKDNPFSGLRISYATQYIPNGRAKPFGTADAVSQALEQYPHLQKEAFTVCNSDNLYSVIALKALATTNSPNAFIAYDRNGLQFSSDRISNFALVLLDENRNLIDITEKPAATNIEKYKDAEGKFWVSMNIFKFDGSAMFQYLNDCPIHPKRNEKELPTAVLNFCGDHPGQFEALTFCEHVPDLTSKKDIKIFKDYLKKYY
jgi:glucose-1-phosphate thymidylyltransferase